MTKGVEYFRNTGIGDILEITGIWQYPSNFKIQQANKPTEVALDKEVSEVEAEIALNIGENLRIPTRVTQRAGYRFR